MLILLKYSDKHACTYATVCLQVRERVLGKFLLDKKFSCSSPELFRPSTFFHLKDRRRLLIKRRQFSRRNHVLLKFDWLREVYRQTSKDDEYSAIQVRKQNTCLIWMSLSTGCTWVHDVLECRMVRLLSLRLNVSSYNCNRDTLCVVFSRPCLLAQYEFVRQIIYSCSCYIV